MKFHKLAPVLAVAVLTAGLAPTTTQAQDTTRKESKGDVAKMVSLPTVIASIDGILAEIARLKTVTVLTPAAVQIVDVGLVSGANDSLVNAAVERNKANIATLQTTLAENAIVKEALAKQTPALTTADVIGIRVAADNTVQVFHRKPM